MKHNAALQLLLIFCLAWAPIAFAQPSAALDSLTTIIPQSKGEAKLEASYQACLEASRYCDIDNELALLHSYQVEAMRQSNTKHEMMARTLRLYTFYNSNLHDSLFHYINDDLEVLQKNQQWDFYYSCRSLMVESYRYSNRLQSALQEAQAMYSNAISQNNNYGKGVAAYLIASCQQSMNRNAQAVEFFKIAEACMLKEGNVGQLHNMYGIAWESYLATGQLEDLQLLLDRWDNMWRDYCQKNKMELTDIAIYYMVCAAVRAHLYIDRREFPAARKELDHAASLCENKKEIAHALWLKEEARYAEATGDLEQTLYYLDKCYQIQMDQQNRIAAVATQEMRANVLMKMGRTTQAAHIYAELLPEKEAVMQLDMAAQLDDFSSIYKVDTLKEEKAQLRNWLTIALTGCTLMLVLFAIYFYYHRQLQAKNKTIISQYHKHKNTEKIIEEILESRSHAPSLDKDMMLFIEIKRFLGNKEVLASPALDRNLLAREFNTNHTYISNAIQAGAGVNVSTYINQVRIDYACELLKEKETKSVAQVQTMCGFQSRSYFYRIFKNQMNMSPSEFQKELGK